MIDFLAYCNNVSELQLEAEAEIRASLRVLSLQKGEFLLRKGQVCGHIYFIDAGLLKVVSSQNDKEIIMRFFSEESMLTQLKSFSTQQPSDYSIQAIEPCEITYLSYAEIERLSKKYHCVETFYRKLLTQAALVMMERILEMLQETPAQRYHKFVVRNKAILQRISLGDLAHYLGISQVSLSRIRAK